MKKQIIIASTIAVAILGASGFAILNTASATKENDKLLAATSTLEPKTIVPNSSKNETVYIITDESGNVKTKFIGNTIYSGDEALPYEFKITYFLDGNEISAKELAGKSGHIKIAFDYSSTAKKNGSFIPFLALTTLTLNQNNFSNLKLQNAKVLEEKSGNYIIAGYSITGLNENLDTDILPNSFVLEADTTNFKLENTYTIFTNELIADFDTSKLNDLDNLKNSIYQLQDAMNKLVDGATKLSSGVDSLTSGISKLQSGTDTLNSGAGELATGLSTLKEKVENELIAKLTTLATNLVSLSSNSEDLNTKVQGAFTNIITSLNTIASNTGDATTTAQINNLISSLETSLPILYTSLGTYTGSVDAIATGVVNMDTSELTNGITALSSGANTLYTGTTTLKNGMDTLASGANELSAGSKALKDGLITFKTSGIDKLVNFASKDLTSFTRNLRSSITAASSYKSFGGADAKSVKFIVKTPSI